MAQLSVTARTGATECAIAQRGSFPYRSIQKSKNSQEPCPLLFCPLPVEGKLSTPIGVEASGWGKGEPRNGQPDKTRAVDSCGRRDRPHHHFCRVRRAAVKGGHYCADRYKTKIKRHLPVRLPGYPGHNAWVVGRIWKKRGCEKRSP
jgi:hypothetical protein